MNNVSENVSWKFDDLSNDIKLEVLQYLDMITLVRGGSVSKDWRRLFNNDLVWKRLLNTHFPNYHEKILPNKNFSEFYKKAELTIYRRIESTNGLSQYSTPFKPHEKSLFRAAKNNDVVAFKKILDKEYNSLYKLITLFTLNDSNHYSIFDWIGKLGHQELADLFFYKIRTFWEIKHLKQESINIFTIAAALNQVSFLKHDIEIATTLLNNNSETNTADMNPLITACEYNNYETVVFLIEQGLKIKNTLNKDAGNCLHTASKSGNTKLINYLVTQGLDIDLLDQHTMTPLMHAINHENLDAVKALIQAGANINIVSEKLNSNCLVLAYYKTNDAIVDLLFTQEADTKLLYQKYYNPYPNQKVLTKLFNHILKIHFPGSSITDYEKSDNKGNTRIHVHAFCNISEGLNNYPKYLLNQLNDFKFTPLHVAAIQNNLEVTRALIDSGAKNDILGQFHRTPFFCAIEGGFIELVKYFMELETTDINTHNASNCSALQKACEKGHLAIVKQLLCNPKIDINAQDLQHKTPLIAAAQKGHLEILGELLMHPKININMDTMKGHNALYWSTKNGFHNCANLILLLKDCCNDNSSNKNNIADINQDSIVNFLVSKRSQFSFINVKSIFLSTLQMFSFMNSQNEKSTSDIIFDEMIETLRERSYELHDIINIIHSAYSELIKNQCFDHNLRAVGSCLKQLNQYVKSHLVNEPLTYQNNNNLTGP